MRYLLDTNVCIAALRNHPQVVARMAAVTSAECAISSITSYELFTGVEKSADPAKELGKVSRLLGTIRELAFDAPSAREAGRIRAVVEAQGCMIGPYDVLLAGHALAADLTLVTANIGEFKRVPGLKLEDWQAPPGA